MPCRDYYDENPSAYYANTIDNLKKQISFAESALCAVIQALTECDRSSELVSFADPFRWIDFKETGITRQELVYWYENHKRLDQEQTRKEQEKQRKEFVRQQALKKLSDEEKEALGIEK